MPFRLGTRDGFAAEHGKILVAIMPAENSSATSPSTNTDFTLPVVVAAAQLAWHASPSPSVWRKSLYREGGESGPVTSLVRYDANSRFASHAHPQGEEILVLDGVFSDETGDYPAGTYLLNPTGSRHAPFSKPGCVLFVHLRQYRGENRRQAAINTDLLAWTPGATTDIEQKLLYAQDGYPEVVTLERWQAGARRSFDIKQIGRAHV